LFWARTCSQCAMSRTNLSTRSRWKCIPGKRCALSISQQTGHMLRGKDVCNIEQYLRSERLQFHAWPTARVGFGRCTTKEWRHSTLKQGPRASVGTYRDACLAVGAKPNLYQG
jgi:hypothetical protein